MEWLHGQLQRRSLATARRSDQYHENDGNRLPSGCELAHPLVTHGSSQHSEHRGAQVVEVKPLVLMKRQRNALNLLWKYTDGEGWAVPIKRLLITGFHRCGFLL